MWRMKIKLKHNCLFGSSCEKAKVDCVNVSFNVFRKGKNYFVYHFGTVLGKNYKEFLKLIKKDSRTHYLESDGRTFLAIEQREGREIPGMHITPEFIYVKPVHVYADGSETWELAAIKKETLMDFVRHFKQAAIVFLEQTKLRDIYFPRLSPNLSPGQRDAFELAKKEGYYEFPKRITLDTLAAIAGVAKSTFREHLKRAERKILSEY